MLPRLALLFPLLFCPRAQANSLQFYIEPQQKVVPTYVQQLVEGSIHKIQQGSQMRASVSLIYDGGYYILVDTPSATDIRGKEAMLKGNPPGISSRNIVPGEIQLKVQTHGHPDHFGQDNFFPNARHFFGSYEYSDDTFISTELKNSPRMQLTKNVELWTTPGHTSQDVSVIVRNVPCCGTVAVVGDLFYDEEDAFNGTEWFAEAWNPLVGKLNRDKIICHADYIIPGHGKLFMISEEMKANAACDGSSTGEEVNENGGDYGRKRDPSTVSFTYTYPTTTTTASPRPPTTTITSTTTTTPLPTTTPFFITNVNNALPYVVNEVIPNAANQLEDQMKKAQEKKENILAPVVETAAMQLSRLLKMETAPVKVNTTYPYTSYWQRAFNKLAVSLSDMLTTVQTDISPQNLQKALSTENVENFKERMRTYRQPAVDAVFKLFNNAYLNPHFNNGRRV